MTVTQSPACKLRGFQPWRDKPTGLSISIPHSTAGALAFAASGTSNWIQQCGLIHWNSLTVPVSVISLFGSNMAAEWCAGTAAAANSRAAASRVFASRFIVGSLVDVTADVAISVKGLPLRI